MRTPRTPASKWCARSCSTRRGTGGATQAEVSIRRAEADLVRIRVRETGGRTPAEQNPGAGLGGTMIETVSSRWWVHHEGEARVTSVLMPTGTAISPLLPEPEPAGR